MGIKYSNRLFLFFLCLFTSIAFSQEKPLWHGITRKIHYAPDGNSFVLKNGTRKFNRALYGTNTYLKNGHNFQDERLRLYLPGNGGVLTAVAMMCAGWDGSTQENPGFPKDGSWKVKWEGFQKMF